MNKKIIVIAIIVAAVGFVVLSMPDEKGKVDKPVFHVTLADPQMYQEDGVFTGSFPAKAGEYSFRFVPNGDSPESLSISLNGESLSFHENFTLNGTSHETGISQYYTWDYDGQKKIEIPEGQDITIQIDPNGNLLGAVSVDILED